MLEIKDISKQYKTGDLIQKALDHVSLNLRDNEFVAILGPSGSGKTTLLNIIGGLDRYDSGDLVINGISTKKYKDRDWDSCSAQKICCGNTSGTTADNSSLPSVGDRRRLFQRTHQCVISVFRRHELRFPNMNGFIIVISSTLCLAAVGANGSCGEGEGIFLRNER